MLKVSNALARPDMPRWLRRPYALWLKLQGRVFDRLIGLSEPMSREIAALTGAAPDRVVTIANPVLTRQRLRDLATLPRSRGRDGATRYVAAGRLVAQKNYPLMLRGFARCARPGDTLTIAGAGPDRDAILRVVSRLGLTGRVRLVGHLGSVDALLAQADAFVLSSDYEGLPGVVVEAPAMVLPVLATDCCASMACLVEAGVTGVLVPPGCEHAMARGVRGGAADDRRAAPRPATGGALRSGTVCRAVPPGHGRAVRPRSPAGRHRPRVPRPASARPRAKLMFASCRSLS
ncbi:glycosyltransferase [Novosphingobium colocasiae]